jgi:para-aminobenzoate synthetase component 1
LAVAFYDWVIGFDHKSGRGWLVSTGLPEAEPGRRQRRARRRLAQVKDLLRSEPMPFSLPPQSPPKRLAAHWEVPGLPGVTSNFQRARYLDTVRRAIEYIHAGDCFQVNLAQRLLHPVVESPVTLYQRLRERNPAPFAGYFDLGEFVIASASPERFLHLANGGAAA